MTTERFRELLEKATPGPWQYCGRRILGHGEKTVTVTDATNRNNNGPLITTAVNALPALLDVIEAAQASLEGWEGGVCLIDPPCGNCHPCRLSTAIGRFREMP